MRHELMTRAGLVALLCLLPLTLFAALETPRQQAPGKLRLQPPPQVARFFGNLDPATSVRGQVKTFVVKAEKDRDELRDEREAPVSRSLISTASLKPFNGSFIMPVTGEVSSAFGRRAHPFRKVRHFHTGVDIRARRGTSIMAAASGRVVYAGWRRGYGMMVEMEHGSGFRTVYAHCSKLLVRVGTMVQAGQTVGLVGNTGVTTGCHLHFEIMRGSVLIDPLSFFRRA